MPNWCYTSYVFHGSEDHLKTLHDKIYAWTSNELRKSDFGSAWLGNILIGAGLGDRIDNPDESQRLRCRGSISIISEIEDGKFDLYTETAWSEMAAMWKCVIDKLELDVTFSYFAEECGMGYYVVYDPENKDFSDYDYYVDAYVELENNEKIMWVIDCREMTEADLLKELQETFDTDSTDLSKLIERIETYPFESEDSYIGIHPVYRLTEIN